MSRRLKRVLIGLAITLVAGVAFIWTLPEIIKWQALQRLPELTGRVHEIEDIDLNPFTGRLAIKKLRIAEADPAQTFIALERLDLRVIPWSMVFGHVRVTELVFTEPTVNLVRIGPTEFNFTSDYPRHTAQIVRSYYGHSTGAEGSSLVSLTTPDGANTGYIVVNGIDRTIESGSGHIAKYAMLSWSRLAA